MLHCFKVILYFGDSFIIILHFLLFDLVKCDLYLISVKKRSEL